jgi:UDP:flavonoid glycosyltransferase YjiC (YdhE family)
MRVLLTSHGISSHVFPLVPLARALSEAGHAVCFATSPDLGAALRRLGFETRDVGPTWRGDPQIERLRAEAEEHLGPDHLVHAVRQIFIGHLCPRMLPEIESAVASWRPDVVLSEVSEFAGPLVAERAGLPSGQVAFGIDPPAPFRQHVVGGALDEVRTSLGLSPDPELDRGRRFLGLFFAPRSYQPAGAPLGQTSHALRPELFDAIGDEQLPDWIDEVRDRPLVYATLGTVFGGTPGVFEAIADGLAEEPVNVVATLGTDVDPRRLEGRARNLRVATYIPNSLLLPRCDALVAHAGYGTVMGGLCHGLPMVLLPLGADQFVHAARCEALGVALTVSPDAITPKAIRDALVRVRGEPGYRKRARELRAEMASMPGVRRAVELIEELVRRGAPVIRHGP